MFTNSIWRGKNKANFSAILLELGNFQDKSTGISFLKIKGVNNLNKHNKAQLVDIKKRWLKEKAAIKKELVLHLKKELLAK